MAILDADKEGFLRSERSLIQTCGRAARNINGTVVFYGDQITNSMRRAMDESDRRRTIQLEYNRIHNITPSSIRKNIDDILGSTYEADYMTVPIVAEEERAYVTLEDLEKIIVDLTAKMKGAAANLDFEKAAAFRDQIRDLEEKGLDVLGFS